MNPQLQLALWITQPILQMTVAGVMYWRKLHKTFPIFFLYLISQIGVFATVFSAYRWGSYAQYFYSYWFCAALSLALGFKVIHEVFLDVFRPYHTLKDLGSVLFKWAALVMLLVAGVVMAASPTAADPMVQSVLTLQRCVRVIQCGLVLFLLVFSRYLGVSWKQHSFGIILGFGGFASIELAIVALHASEHLSQPMSNAVNTIAYNLTIVVWFVYAYVKGPVREATATLLMSQRWEQSLNDLQRPASNDALIPMFESMVDRAFSRTNGEPAAQETKELATHKMSVSLAIPSLSEPPLPSKR